MSATGESNDDAVPDQQASRTPVTQIIGRLVVVLLLAVFLVFAAANAQYVSFSWVIGETRATFDETGGHLDGGVRLIFLLIASLVIGLVIGVLLSWQDARRKRRAAREDD
jgi:uncharacterized integral membrane protein